VPIGYWSTLEVHISIIIACSPALRALVKTVFPNFRLGPTTIYENSMSIDTKSKIIATDRSGSRMSIGGKDDLVPLKDEERGKRFQTERFNPKGNIRVDHTWELETYNKAG
jgi:hypothetical protein